MLKDTELVELARAVAALGDEDAGRPYDHMVDGYLGPRLACLPRGNLAVTCELIEGSGEDLTPGIQFGADGRPVAYVIAPAPKRTRDADLPQVGSFHA